MQGNPEFSETKRWNISGKTMLIIAAIPRGGEILQSLRSVMGSLCLLAVLFMLGACVEVKAENKSRPCKLR